MKDRFPQVTNRSPSARLGRVAMAFVLACALILSFFHDLSPIEAHEASAGSAITATLDLATKAPAHHAPAQGDHCLTHLASKLWQEPLPVPAAFGGAAYLVRDEAPPHPMDGLSPFKPPRA